MPWDDFDINNRDITDSSNMEDLSDLGELSDAPPSFGDVIPEEEFMSNTSDLAESSGSIEQLDVAPSLGDVIPEEEFMSDTSDLTESSDSIEQLDVAPSLGDVIPEEEFMSDTSDLTESSGSVEPIDTSTPPNDVNQEGLTDTVSDMIGETDMPSDTAASAYDQLADYYALHNYGQQDFAEYSKDPEWQELNNAYLQELGREPIDYGNNDTPNIDDIRDMFVSAGIPEDSPELAAILANEQAGINSISNQDVGVISDSPAISLVDDVSNWLGEINPNFDAFDPESPYCNNCGSCAYAVYQRFEGSTDSCASADNIGDNRTMEALTGMDQVSMSPLEIEQRLLAEGDGAHAIIGIDRAEGPGHWFNAACINGKVVAIDGQSGDIYDWPPDYGDVVNWDMSIKRRQK